MKEILTIDEYIASFPKNVQVLLEKIRHTIRAAADGTTETIRYKIPTFQLHGKNLLHFAGYKQHIGFYPTPSAIVAFKKELSSYKQAKGSVQFPLNEPIPLPLIKKIAVFRIKELKKGLKSHQRI